MVIKSDLHLSIILPIYNVEPYLEKCIRSLEDQDIPRDSYEIICMNDGSPDNSKQIVLELQKEYFNIILIDQKNRGVSVARNNGIKASKGKYLMFVDPDDAIQENCLKDFLSFADNQQLDISYSPFTFVEMDGGIKESSYQKCIGEIIEGVDLYFAIRGEKIIDPDRSVAILYNRDLIIENKLFYLKDVPYLEDGEFISRVFCLAKRTSIYNIPFYLRLNRPGSATRSDLIFQKRSLKGFLKAAVNLRIFQNNEYLDLKQKIFLNQPITKFVLLAVRSAISSKNISNFFYVKNVLKRNNLLHLDLKGNLDKFKEMGRVFNRSIYLFCIYWVKESLKKKYINR